MARKPKTMNEVDAMVNEIEGTPADETVVEPVTVANDVAPEPDPITETQPVAEPTVKEPVVPETYTPNYKFKVQDVEYDIDDTFKPLIKDKDTEAKVRDIMERAKGLDAVKEHRDRYKTERDTERTKVTQYATEYEKVMGHLAKGDKYLEQGDSLSALKHLGFTEEQIKQAALILVDEEKRAKHEVESARRNAEMTLSEKETGYERRIHEMNLSKLETEMKMELSRPEHNDVISKYNKLKGNPSAFMNAVIDYGAMKENAGVPIDAQGAVKGFINDFLFNFNTPATPVAPVMPVSERIVAPAKGNNIPSVTNAGSPARAKPKSMADLQKIIDEQEAAK